jgi:hypothetical protein
VTKKVYDTNWASSEEVSDILALLQRHAISHYETPKGAFGPLRVRQQYESAPQGTGLVAILLNVRRLIVERPHQAFLYLVIVAGLIAIHWWFFKALSG